MKQAIILIAFLTITALTLANVPQSTAEVYRKKCARCHGGDGDKGASGAPKLSTSVLSHTEAYNLIANGRKKMPAWKSKLSPVVIDSLSSYVLRFRKN